MFVYRDAIPLTAQLDSKSRIGTSRAVSRPVDVAYCVHREGLSSVFHSQVIVPLSRHGAGVNVRLAVHTPLGHLWRESWRDRLDAVAERCRNAHLNVDWLASPPARLRWLFSDDRQLMHWIRRNYQGEELILHCRNAAMTDIALRVRERLTGARVIYDCRGAEAVELEQQLQQAAGSEGLTPQMHSRLKEVEVREARCTREADHILCVSRAMCDYLADAHGVTEQKMTVVPCCLDAAPFQAALSTRDQVRKELGLQDRLVVTYCGSLAWYQLPEQSLRIVRLLRQQNDQVHFLAITTQPDQMAREIKSAGIPNDAATVVSVAPSEVPRYLSAGDIGLLLRDETLVNRVASPVKFSEYMAAGLPVVISANLGDYSAAVRDHGLGVVVSLADSDESIQSQLLRLSESADLARDQYRDRCQEFADQQLSWSRHLPRVSALYLQLTGAP